MAKQTTMREAEAAAQALAREQGVTLVDAGIEREGQSRYLRLYIDKPGGVTLDDCERFHRAVAPMVEAVDYDFLEVCSPGLDRPLKKQADYDAHVGDRVELHLYKPREGVKRFEGTLLGLQSGEVQLEAPVGTLMFPLAEVSLCKPVIEVTEELLAEAEDEA